jgi:hypothetical protein
MILTNKLKRRKANEAGSFKSGMEQIGRDLNKRNQRERHEVSEFHGVLTIELVRLVRS